MLELARPPALSLTGAGAMLMKATPPRPLGVLIVDDDELMRRFVGRVLTAAGYRIAVASDGPDAIELAGSAGEPIDLLVTDVMMPQMTGNELARRLRVMTPEIKVLYLTGFTD